MDRPRPPLPPAAPVAVASDGLYLAASWLFVPAKREFEEISQDVNFLNELLSLPGLLERKLGVRNTKLDSRLAKQIGLRSVNFNSNFTTASAEASKYRRDVAADSVAEAQAVRTRRERLLIFAAERGVQVSRRRALLKLESDAVAAPAPPPTVAAPASAAGAAPGTVVPAASSPAPAAAAAVGKAPPSLPRKTKAKKVAADGTLLSSSDQKSTGIEVPMPDCNQLLLSVGESVSSSHRLQKMTGDPIFCKSCSAALNSTSKVERAPAIAISSSEELSNWQCEFCGTTNTCRIDKEEIPTTPFAEYLVEPPQRGGDVASPLVVFCIDTSGSMCVTTEVNQQVRLPPALAALVERERAEMRKFIEGNAAQWMPRQSQQAAYVSRLQCVQTSVQSQIARLHADSPQTRVAIVLFNSEVVVLGDGSQAPLTLAGDVLSDYDALMSRGGSFAAFQRPVAESHKDLEAKIFEVESRGATALGPALIVSAAIAAHAPASKIILCTDGKANVGLGNVEATIRPAAPAPARGKLPALPPRGGPPAAAPAAAVDDPFAKARNDVEQFYRKVAGYAKSNSSSISVVSIRGDDCSLENLGLLADITGGQVEIVDPIDLERNFAGLLAKPVIARAASVQLCLPRPFLPEPLRDVGNVNSDTAITFEWAVKAPLDFAPAAGLPVQVQLRYTAPDGTKLLRVISRNPPSSHDRNLTEAVVDTAVVSIRAIHKSAELAHKGDYQAARVNMMAAMHFIQRCMKNKESQKDYISFILQGEKLDGFMRTKAAQDAALKKEGGDQDRRAARDDAASKSIFQMKSLTRVAFKSQAL